MKSIFLALATLFLVSCGSKEAQPIKLHTDACDFCKMSIADGKFGAEVITEKGRCYKFDDLSCMMYFAKENTDIAVFYVNDYAEDNTLISAETSFFLRGGDLRSPMRGNYAAFSSEDLRNEYQPKVNAEAVTWDQVLKDFR